MNINTSNTDPWSVRLLCMTTIAARMRGEYHYVVLNGEQGTATPLTSREEKEGAELGMFHFIFLEE